MDMKRFTKGLALATLFAVASSTTVNAQDESATEAVESPPVADSPAPLAESPAPAVDNTPPALIVESPAPQVETGLLAQSGRSGRGSSRSSQNNPFQRGDGQRDQRDSGQRDQRGSGFRDFGQRDDGRRDFDRRDFDRRDDGRRSNFGINIGPGGVQVFRTDPGVGRGNFGSRGFNDFNGRNRGLFDRGWGGRSYWNGPSNWYGDRYWSRGWGVGVYTQPSYVYPSNPVIITEPQTVQPSSSGKSPVPTREQLAEMPGFELQGLLLYAVDQLDNQLGGLSTGGDWRSYLKVEELRQIVPVPPEPPAQGSTEQQPPADQPNPFTEEQVRRQLADILKKYDSTHQNQDFRQINQLWGFRTTRLVLQEVVIPPAERLRKQLPMAVKLLKEDLQKYETGTGWQKHLRLADTERIAALPAAEVAPADRNLVQVLVGIFDSTAADQSYKTVSEMPGFRWTHYVLRSYLDELGRPSLPAPPAGQPSLPAPPAKP